MADRRLEPKTLPTYADDPFKAFRDIALLEVHHQFTYRHSLGKVSKFFLELEKGRLFATRCGACGSVYLPPRAVCPEDLSVTEWCELSGRGTLKSWTLCRRSPAYAQTEEPYLLAYVKLDGTDSLLLHQLKNASADSLRYDLGVKTVFGESATRHPLERMWFEPL